MRVLVIEDDKELALVLKEGLEKRGLTVDVPTFRTLAQQEPRGFV